MRSENRVSWPCSTCPFPSSALWHCSLLQVLELLLNMHALGSIQPTSASLIHYCSALNSRQDHAPRHVRGHQLAGALVDSSQQLGVPVPCKLMALLAYLTWERIATARPWRTTPRHLGRRCNSPAFLYWDEHLGICSAGPPEHCLPGLAGGALGKRRASRYQACELSLCRPDRHRMCICNSRKAAGSDWAGVIPAKTGGHP